MPLPTLSLPSQSHILKPKSNKPNKSCIIKSINNLCSKGQIKQAIQSLYLLPKTGLRLDSPTLSLLLKHCSNLKLLKQGKLLHTHLKLTGFKRPGLFVSNSLIDMYAKCGDFVEARKVFDKMPERNLYSWNILLSGYAGLGMIKPARKVFDKMPKRDVVSWNIMVVGYAKMGYFDEALRFYKWLRRFSVGVNEFSFSGVLNVCVETKDLWLTRQVHCQVFIMGFLLNVVVSSSVVDSYSKCEDMVDGRRVFDEMGTKDVLAWTTLVSGYSRCGDMESASELFNLMPEKNSVSWTSLISGYARNDMGSNALESFKKMMFFRIRPDQFTFSSCLCACTSISSLKHGKQIHAYLIRTGFKPNTIVVSSLIDMYSKCGYLNFGRQVFRVMGNKRDPMLWNTMISALTYHGHYDNAIKFYFDMVSLGVKPDRITFLVIVSACRDSGYVEGGIKFFRLMTSQYGIIPDEELHACLVDLLGRFGCFEELINKLYKMHCRPDKSFWDAMLGAYVKYMKL